MRSPGSRRRRASRTPLTLREAAAAVGLSVATLRRHIRRGRLQAERVRKKYGEEYRIRPAALAALGLPIRLPPPGPVPDAPADRAWLPPLHALRQLAAALERLPNELAALCRELHRLRGALASRLDRRRPGQARR